NDHLRTTLQFERATDQTYLKRFGFMGLGNKSVLTTKANLEGFYGRSYFSLENYRFQGLRTDDRDATTPLILPVLNAEYIAPSSCLGEEWRFKFNALNLNRREGDSVRRLSSEANVHLPLISSWGNVYDIGAKMRTDLYNSVIMDPTTRASDENTTGRFLPQFFANWRFPMIKATEKNHFMVEPVAGVVVGTQSGPNPKIPIEDASIEYSIYNFDSESRFAGLDIVDGGTRFNYGANFDSDTKDYGKANIFMGQSVSIQKPKAFLQNTGLDNRLGDVVAGIRYNFEDWLDLRSRALLDRTTWTTKRHEFMIKFGQPVLNLSSTYTLLPKQEFFNITRKTEQLGLLLNTQINENWSGNLNSIRELGSGGGSLSHGVSVTYSDECFIFSASISKNFYRDRDLKPGTTIFFRLVFKNIGEVSQRTTMNNNDISDPLASERRRLLGIF
ncbi:MAG: LPS-assembly protein LptD, partial [Candidatus Nucleicultricaceae bacterium]